MNQLFNKKNKNLTNQNKFLFCFINFKLLKKE